MSSRWNLIAATVVATATLGVAACGSSEETGPGTGSPPGPTTQSPGTSAGNDSGSESEKGIPKALAANRAEANQILDEGQLDAKLESLRGHPVVVNQWASWCPPCREEFPYFRQSAEDHAAEVAFVGIDMQDEAAAAEQFLAEEPIPYPSIDDPSASQILSLGGGIVSPTTVFIDENGEVVNVFQGAYTSQDQLEQDIDKHLLG